MGVLFAPANLHLSFLLPSSLFNGLENLSHTLFHRPPSFRFIKSRSFFPMVVRKQGSSSSSLPHLSKGKRKALSRVEKEESLCVLQLGFGGDVMCLIKNNPPLYFSFQVGAAMHACYTAIVGEERSINGPSAAIHSMHALHDTVTSFSLCYKKRGTKEKSLSIRGILNGRCMAAKMPMRKENRPVFSLPGH